MLIESNMQLLMYVFVYTKTLHSLLFELSHEQRRHLPLYFATFLFQDQYFYIQKDSQKNLYYKLI